MLWDVSKSSSVHVQTFPEFPYLSADPFSGSFSWNRDLREIDSRVIKEMSVHSEVDVTLTTGGTERSDLSSFHHLEHRKTIVRSLWAVKFSGFVCGVKTELAMF